MPNPSIEVAIAILQKDSQFLLQLRDDIPGIFYPGQWGFFGGHLEPEESPDAAVRRELWEEIGYVPPQVTLFRQYVENQVIRHVFYAPLTAAVEDLDLQEGWDLGLFTIADIQRGDRYSERAAQVRPLGTPHQKILLDFIAQNATPTV
jgi:8-oxo-dGTP diphosphatase